MANGPTALERSLAGETSDDVTPMDAFNEARRRFLRGQRIDMQELAADLGVSRATLYRWVGSRERLLGEICWSLADLGVQEAKAAATARGRERVVQIFEYFLELAARHGPLRRFVESEPELGLRILTSKAGVVQQRQVEINRGLVLEAIEEDGVQLRLDADTLAYVIVRIGESYVWREFITGDEPDIQQAAEVIRVLLST